MRKGESGSGCCLVFFFSVMLVQVRRGRVRGDSRCVVAAVLLFIVLIREGGGRLRRDLGVLLLSL